MNSPPSQSRTSECLRTTPTVEKYVQDSPFPPRTGTITNDVVDSKQLTSKSSLITRFLHSFRSREDIPQNRLKGSRDCSFSSPESIGNDTSRLNRSLQGRHMQMIAIGGAIGTGLFVGSGSALATGGPGALMIAFGMIGVMLFFVVHALGELSVMFPVAGNFLESNVIDVRFIFDIFDTFYRSCLGICDGLELCDGMAHHAAS